MKVFEFRYTSDIHESCLATVSIHLTKEGAEKAMHFHKWAILTEWEESCKRYPGAADYPFDYGQMWDVKETEVLQ